MPQWTDCLAFDGDTKRGILEKAAEALRYGHNPGSMAIFLRAD
jgi:hypothetical protein